MSPLFSLQKNVSVGNRIKEFSLKNKNYQK